MIKSEPVLREDELVRVDGLRLGDRIIHRGQLRAVAALAWSGGPSFIRLTFAAGDEIILQASHRISKEKNESSKGQ